MKWVTTSLTDSRQLFIFLYTYIKKNLYNRLYILHPSKCASINPYNQRILKRLDVI